LTDHHVTCLQPDSGHIGSIDTHCVCVD